MGSRVLAVWECDRCHATKDGPDSYQPSTWVAIQQTSPPRASFENSNRWTLCGDCFASYLDWWNIPAGAHTDGSAALGDDLGDGHVGEPGGSGDGAP